jgi:hypothetical protein
MMHRQRFSAKLHNLPPGTTAYDLREILTSTNALTCYIPRKNNYTRRQFAIIAFKDQEGVDNVLNSTITLGKTQLFWTSVQTKLCSICDSADHLVVACPIKHQREERRELQWNQANKFGNLYNRYKPANTFQIRKIAKEIRPSRINTTLNKSYAEALKQPRPNNQHHKDNNQVMNMLKSIKHEIAQIKIEIVKINKRVDLLEQDAYYQHVDDDTMEETTSSSETEETPSEHESINYSPSTLNNNFTTPSEQISDIRSIQHNLLNTVDRIGDNMHQFMSTYGDINLINARTNINRSNSPSTPSWDEQQ